MRRKATSVVLGTLVGILFGACDFSKEQFTGDAALPPPTVAFVQATQLQDENSGLIQVVVRLSRASDEAVSVSWAITGGTAENGASLDYTSEVSGVLEFMPGQTDLGIPLTINFDTDETEEDEDIIFTLTSPTGAELGTTKQHTVTISSELLPRVTFAAATSMSAEQNADNNLMLMLVLDRAPTVESTVTFSYIPGMTTAALTHDWTLPMQTTVTFPVNTLAQMISIPVKGDAIDELNENFVLELTTTSALVVGPTSTHAHTIENDDTAPTVSITTASGTTMEGNTGNTNVVVTVTLSGPSGKEVTVPITYGGGNATEGADFMYMAKPATLTFVTNQDPAMADVSETITIQIIGDTTDEDNQTVVTSLVDTPTNATLAATNLVHTLTIGDDDNAPDVNFTTADQTVMEGDGPDITTNYELTLTAASEKMIGFDIELTGTATRPGDYTPNPNVIMSTSRVRMTIDPGMTTATLGLIVVGDTVDEGNTPETIIMNILNSNLMNVGRGQQRTRTHTITDSD